MDYVIEDKVLQLLKQFDVLLTEIASLSLDDLRLVLAEISQKIEDFRAEIGEDCENAQNAQLSPAFATDFDESAYVATEEKNEIVVVLNAGDLKIEHCDATGFDENSGKDGESEDEISCLYVLSEPMGSGGEEQTVTAKVHFGDYDESSRGGSDVNMSVVDEFDDNVSNSDVESDLEFDFQLERPSSSCSTACPECGEELGTRRALVTHVTQAHPGRTASLYTCSLCDKQFRSANGLKYHRETKHEDKGALDSEQYRCERPDCSYRTGNRVLLRMHRYSHNNAPLTCPVCRKNFLGKFNLPLVGSVQLLKSMAYFMAYFFNS